MLDQGWSGEGLEIGKLERRAAHATERSAVECGDRSGGCVQRQFINPLSDN